MAANESSTHTHAVISEHEWAFELESATDVAAQGELSFIQKCAREIAIVSKEMGSFKFFIGRGLSFPARIGRLVRLRQMAIEAERKGKYVRADFLWQQAQSRLIEVVKCVSGWQEFIVEVSNRYGILQDAAAVDQISKSFVRELFLDTHWALYNGLRSITASPDPCHRCFIHLNYIRQLKRLCADFSFSDDSESILDTKRELDAMRAGKQWHEAWKLAREIANRFPDEEEYVHLAADIQLSATFDGLLNAESQTALSKNAEKINEGIEALNILRNRAP